MEAFSNVRTDADQSHEPRAALPVVLAGVVGMGIGLLGRGFLQVFVNITDGSAERRALAVAAILFGVGIGPWLPHRFAMWTARRTWRRKFRADRIWDQFEPLQLEGQIDRAFAWAVVGVIGMVTGAATCATLVVPTGGGKAYEYLLENFLWTPPTLWLMDLVLAAICVIVPCGLSGLLLNCLGKLETRHQVCSVHPLSVALSTAGIVAFAAANLADSVRPEVWIAAGGLPFFAVSLSAALVTGRIEPAADVAGRAAVNLAPEASDRWMPLLIAAVAVAAFVGGAQVVVWDRLFRDYFAITTDTWGMFAAICFSAGMWLVGWSGRKRNYSVGGLGLAFAASGTLAAAGLCTIGLSPSSDDVWARLFVPAAGVAAGATGFAMAYGYSAVHVRMVHASVSRAPLITASGLGGALGLACASGVLLPEVGPLVTGALAAVILMAVGGVLIIHEDGYQASTRRRRLACVFASLIAMIFILPRAAAGWGSSLSQRRVHLSSTLDWPGHVSAPDVTTRACPRRRVRSLLIGRLPDDLSSLLGNLEPWTARWDSPGDEPSGSIETLRRLRISRDRFNVIVVTLCSDGLSGSTSSWTRRLLSRLTDKLTPDGGMLVIAPDGHGDNVPINPLRLFEQHLPQPCRKKIIRVPAGREYTMLSFGCHRWPTILEGSLAWRRPDA